MRSNDEAKGVSIGCNYAIKLMREADLIPEGISKLQDAIDFIKNNPNTSYSFTQVEALMNASFFLGADSGIHRAFERIRDRTFIVDNRAKKPRILRNDATTTTQFSFTENYSDIRLNCRIHIPDTSFDGFKTDYRKYEE